MGCHGENKGQSTVSSGLKTAVVLVFVVGGGYYLWMQHRAHVFQYLPFALFLLCPLMHLFGGHGGHDHSADNSKGDLK